MSAAEDSIASSIRTKGATLMWLLWRLLLRLMTKTLSARCCSSITIATDCFRSKTPKTSAVSVGTRALLWHRLGSWVEGLVLVLGLALGL